MRRPGVGVARRSGFRGIGGGSSQWTPAALGAKLIDWYSPESYVAATPAWPSAGGNAYTLAKVTNNPAAGIPINDVATKDFTGLAWLEHGSGALAPATTEVNVFLAVRTGLVDSTQLMMDSNGATNRLTLQVVSPGVFRANAGANLSTASDVLKKDMVHILRCRANGTTSSLYVTDLDGSPVVGPATMGTGTWDGLALGANNAGSSAFGGEIAEVIRTTGSLTAADTAAIEAYLLRRYPSAPKIGWTIRDMMACGDSLTTGIGSTDGRGWRPYVRAAFESQDIETGVQTLRFCGPTRDRCMSTYAASGRVIATIRDGIAAQLAAYSPNCLVICVGTNDCQGDDGAYNAITTPQKLMDTMTNIDTAGFTGRIVLCLIPQQNNVTNNANVTDFNEAITEAGGIYDDSIALGLDVTLCDLNTGLDPATYMVDGVHFNDTGYAAAATRITAAIRAAYAP